MKNEFIGKRIKIIDSDNKNLIGIEGKVVDETKNLIFIENGGKTRKIVKDGSVFEIENRRIEGKEITKRPEERIK